MVVTISPHLYFDGSVLQLVISCYYRNGMRQMPNHCMVEKSVLLFLDNVTVAACISPKRLCLIYLGSDHNPIIISDVH